MIYIKNGEIYTPFKIIRNSGVLIEKDKIKRIGLSSSFVPPAKADVIDVEGKIVCPGFIDVHLQGAGGYDILDTSQEALEIISKTMPRYGVTSFLATTVFKKGKNPHIENCVDFMNKNSDGANILGIHLEGPFINPKKRGMIKPDGISGVNAKLYNRILKVTRGRLKMMTVAPELKGALGIIRDLRKKKIVASFGHSDADGDVTKKAIDAGITHTTHVFNAMRPIHHREPGPLGAILMDKRVSVQLISDGVHIHPSIVKLIVKLNGVDNCVLITDSMSSLGLPDGMYVYDCWEYESKKGACRYKDGTLIGTSLPLNKMMSRIAKFSGVNINDAIKMATLNPARVLGLTGRKGSIEPGKDADIVIMDKNYNCLITIIGGKIAYMKGR